MTDAASEADARARQEMLAVIKAEHAGQFRNNGRVPYWTHCQSVAEILEGAITAGGEFSPSDPTAQALFLAAMGHDLYEDTEIPRARILERFGPLVDDFISFMTNEDGDAHTDRYRAKMTAAPEEARLIKYADLTDNVLSCAYGMHDLGAGWVREFFLPIAGPMRVALEASSFARFQRTADYLRTNLAFAWTRLEQNLAKMDSMEAKLGRPT